MWKKSHRSSLQKASSLAFRRNQLKCPGSTLIKVKAECFSSRNENIEAPAMHHRASNMCTQNESWRFVHFIVTAVAVVFSHARRDKKMLSKVMNDTLGPTPIKPLRFRTHSSFTSVLVFLSSLDCPLLYTYNHSPVPLPRAKSSPQRSPSLPYSTPPPSPPHPTQATLLHPPMKRFLVHCPPLRILLPSPFCFGATPSTYRIGDDASHPFKDEMYDEQQRKGIF